MDVLRVSHHIAMALAAKRCELLVADQLIELQQQAICILPVFDCQCGTQKQHFMRHDGKFLRDCAFGTRFD